MKHLKTFEGLTAKNEIPDFNKLKELVDSNIAYLTDDGFDVRYYVSYPIVTIRIYRGNNWFKWDDIKYDFLPLLELINNNYKLIDYNKDKDSEILINQTDALSLTFSVESVLNDLNSIHTLGRIEFKIDLSQ